jgi:hypothetical protein
VSLRRWSIAGCSTLLLLAGVGAVWLRHDSEPVRHEVVLWPSWDTYVSEAKPEISHGDAVQLRADGAPSVIRSYLCFDVPALPGRVVGLRLRLFANAADRSGILVATTSGAVGSEPVNWLTAPPVGKVVGRGDPVEAGHWVEINVSSLDVRRRSVELILSAAGETMVNYASVDGGRDTAPQLVVEME